MCFSDSGVLERLKHRHFQWIALQIATDETGRRELRRYLLKIAVAVADEVQIQGCGVRQVSK